ncbi:MAG: universal stress protein [Flavobacteriales bacterium]|nr:universal stress protein [Flavobacteriales bacterium]
MKHILVPLDLSPISERTASSGAHLAKALQATLWLIHVAAPEPDFVGLRTGPEHVRAHRAETLRQEHRVLQNMADALKKEGIDARALLVQGPTTETILEEATRLNADMIVMGSHGKGGLMKALVGSVTKEVLARAVVPVLIVPYRS